MADQPTVMAQVNAAFVLTKFFQTKAVANELINARDAQENIKLPGIELLTRCEQILVNFRI